MNTDLSIFHLVQEASFVVQLVMFILLFGFDGVLDFYFFQT